MKRRSPEEIRARQRKAEARKALRHLSRAKAKAAAAGVKLSDWEGEFLGSVAGRVTAYGRAFADPEKGAPGSALSALQKQKLKEIAAKAEGKPKAPRGWRKRAAKAE